MKITSKQQQWILFAFWVALLGFVYFYYLRPTPLTLDTTIPNTPQQGETHIFFRLNNDTLLFPTQCLYAEWDMSNTRGVYINEAGVAAPETSGFCHPPAPNGIFTRLRVVLPDDTSITYDFKVRILAYDPIFLSILIGIALIAIINFAGKIKQIQLFWQILGVVSAVAITLLIAIMLITTTRFLSEKPTVWDDALMFARYAHNLNLTGVWSWNGGESPVFGMTELTYGGAVFITSILNSSLTPVDLVQFTSAIFGILWVLVWLAMAIRYGFIHKSKNLSMTLFVLFLVLMGLSTHTNLLHHFTSGMGTTTVLLYVTLYLILAVIYTQSPTPKMRLVIGIFGGLGFAVRPDVMLFTICVPIAFWVTAKTPQIRREARFIGITTIITLISQMILARLYFGSALPLPFFAKSGGINDGYLANQYVAVSIDQLGTYLYSNRYLVLLIIGGMIGNSKAFIKRIGAVEIGLSVGAIGYIAYYALFVTQIMPEYQRFYYPTLPIIIWLAWIGAVSLAERLWGMLPIAWRFLSIRLRLALISGAIIIVIIALSNTLYETHQFVYQHENQYHPPHDARWYKLAQFAQVNDITVATTEVGAVAVANFSWRVIDMAGLNDTSFALDGFSVDKLLDDYRPDLLYLPYPDYIEMTEAIVTHPRFMQDYTYFTAGQIRLPMGVAIRKDSPAYVQLLTIAQIP